MSHLGISFLDLVRYLDMIQGILQSCLDAVGVRTRLAMDWRVYLLQVGGIIIEVR